MNPLSVLAVFMAGAILHPVSGSAAPAPVVVTPVTFERVHNQTGGPDDAASLAIRNRSEWEKFWATIEPRTDREIGQNEPNAAPEFDFTTHTLLVAALGELAQPGHSVAISAATEVSDEVIVDVVHTIVAGPNCTFIAVITYPVSFATIPATTKAIVFKHSEQRTGCGPQRSGVLQ